MPESRSCAACGRELSPSGKTCECGAAQPASKLRNTAILQAVTGDELAAALAAESAARKPSAHPSQTDDTILHLEQAARQAVEEARDREAQVAQQAAHAAAAAAAASAAANAAGSAADARARRLFSLSRAVLTGAGAILLVVFALNVPLLGALGGNQLILAMYALAGGMILTGAALMPMPRKIRAALATVAGAVPLFVAPPLVELDGWRGLAAAFVVLLLPGALLLRARVPSSANARLLVGACVTLTALIYLVPVQGVVPLAVPLKLLASGSITNLIAGVIALLPLALATGTLTAFAPASSTGYGHFWAGCILASVAGGIVISGLARADLSLVYLGASVAAAGSAAAVGVAQLLDLDPRA